MHKKTIKRDPEFVRIQRKVTNVMMRHPNDYWKMFPIESVEWRVMRYIEASRDFEDQLDELYLRIIRR